MKKFALCLFIVSMVAFVSFGDMNSALANPKDPGLPQVSTVNVDCLDGLIFDQNGNDIGENGPGSEGDPNSLTDGWDLDGSDFIGGLESVIGDGDLTLVEWIRMMLGQLIPNP